MRAIGVVFSAVYGGWVQGAPHWGLVWSVLLECCIVCWRGMLTSNTGRGQVGSTLHMGIHSFVWIVCTQEEASYCSCSIRGIAQCDSVQCHCKASLRLCVCVCVCVCVCMCVCVHTCHLELYPMLTLFRLHKICGRSSGKGTLTWHTLIASTTTLNSYFRT